MPILELKDICKDYQQGREPVRVLKNINLTVEKGDYLAIMGPSGSGKTTLMNIIGCLDVPTSGSYILEGRDLKDLSDDDLAEVRNKHIGFVFQSFHLLPKMEAVDNVALPLLYADVPLKERRARAEEALKAVGLGERIHFLPNQLSGGQCQRVAIARAIVGNPQLLPALCPLAAPQHGTICTAENRKCSEHRRIPPHRPGQGSCRHRSCSSYVPSAAFCGTAGSPSPGQGYAALLS